MFYNKIKFTPIFLYVITLVFLVDTSLFAKTHSTVIHANEAETPLENNVETSLKTTLANFFAKGGTIYRLEGDAAPFQFQIGDVVFPACSAGFNRSQTTWALLTPYADKITVMPPHATRYGFDPYNNQINWHRGGEAPSHDEFILWSGLTKEVKFGWDVFAAWSKKNTASPEELIAMREYYNKYYFNPNTSEKTRRIYITFAKNAHVHVARLVETNASLENVTILFFPLEDLIFKPLKEWRTYSQSKEAYANFANILRTHLDFSQLDSE